MALFTMGYGRTTRERFSKRILTLKETVGAELACYTNSRKLTVVDIREGGCGSMNGLWCRHGMDKDGSKRQGPSMLKTLTELGIPYLAYPDLCNKHGNTYKGLKRYTETLAIKGYSHNAMSELRNMVADGFLKGNRFCLLCAEEKPFKNNGGPNCHRVLLADTIHVSLARPGAALDVKVVHVRDNRKPSFFDGWEKVIKGIEL